MPYIDEDGDDVKVFYPHYVDIYPDYTGGSHCSIKHCGVHKISEKYAKELLIVGEDKINKLNNFLFNTCKIKSFNDDIAFWKNKLKKDKKLRGVDLINTTRFFFGSCNDPCDLRLVKADEQVIEQIEIDLEKAWERFETLFHETIHDLAVGNITTITQGIYLSYPIIKFDRCADSSNRIITIETGEVFWAQRQKQKRTSNRRNIIHYNQCSNKKIKSVKYKLLKIIC